MGEWCYGVIMVGTDCVKLSFFKLQNSKNQVIHNRTMSHSGLTKWFLLENSGDKKKSNSNMDHNSLDVLFYRKAILIR